MSALVGIELIALLAVLAGCAVAYGVVQRRISARNAHERREYLKERARRY